MTANKPRIPDTRLAGDPADLVRRALEILAEESEAWRERAAAAPVVPESHAPGTAVEMPRLARTARGSAR